LNDPYEQFAGVRDGGFLILSDISARKSICTE